MYTGYDALNTNEEYVIFSDYTYYDGNKISNLNDYLSKKLQCSSDVLIPNYYEN